MSPTSDRADPPRALHGRAAECAHIEGLLTDARRGRSGALVIRGEAGIGKSALVAHARAQAAGMTVLSVTGNEFDVEVSYAGLFDLLRPTIAVLDHLPAPQREALHSAFAMGSPSAGSRFGVAIGMLGHLSHLAGQAPVLITVDDGQWLDAASVEAIAFVARRVAAEGIVVLVAERSGVGAASLYGGLPVMALSGLDDDGVAALLAEIGRREPDVGHYRRLTAGNPLVIHELARDAGPAGTDDEEPVAATEAIRTTFLAQVAPLPERCRRALVFVAAAGRNDIPVLPAVLAAAGLSIADLAHAEAEGLLTVDAGHITFRHPLLRSAIYHDASPVVRRAVHVSFADALADLSAPAHAERRVAHLAMAGDLPDEPLAAEMERVGHAAVARSSYATAARMLERAALLSTEPEHRARRYLAAASAALPAGQLGEVGRLVDATFEWSGDAAVRMAASHLAHRASLWQGVPDSVHRFLAGASSFEHADPADAAVILAESGLAALLRGDRLAAVRAADRAIALAADLPGPVRMPGLIVRATLHAMAREHDRARVLLTAAAPFVAARPGEQWPLIAPLLLFLLDDLAVAAQGLELVIAVMRRFGVLDLLPTPLLLQSRIEFRRGDWTRSRIAAHEALSLVSSLGGSASEAGSVLEPDCAAAMAVLEAAAGNAEECKRHARICLAFGTAHGVDFMIGHGRRAFGLLALGAGDFEAAAMQFQELDDVASGYGLCDTPMLPWLADLAEAELATDNRVAAARTVGRLAEHAAAVGTPAAEGLLLRARALVGDEPAPEALEESAGLLRSAGVPFESARSRLHAGRVYRRRKQLGPARQQLISAFDAFDALGAAPWRDHAGAELRASGAAVPDQAPVAAELTAQEQQVVRLAADGESNAQIAMTLFLSKKTVEFHLGKAFRKLGVSRRSQLARIPGVTG